MSGRFPLSAGTLLLVNRDHPLAGEPDGEDLAPVSRRYPQVLLHARAKVMLDQLIQAVGGAGGILPVSGYRSRAEQQDIWDSSLAEHGRAFTETFVARPGCSEHQTGLAIDLAENAPEVDFLCPTFPDTGVCGAFRRRAADYGFILRYPADKTAVTGIGYEPWHFRYVGWPHAKIMEERNFVLEEYLDWLRAFPEWGEHLRYRAGGRSFELCHVPADRLADLDHRLPAGIPCQCSGNNVDGAILTLWRDAV